MRLSLTCSAHEVVCRGLSAAVLQACQEYEVEYEAAKLEVEESWRDAAVKRAAENAARASAGGGNHGEDGSTARNKSRGRKHVDDYEGLGAEGVSGLDSSHYDENGDVRDMCAPAFRLHQPLSQLRGGWVGVCLCSIQHSQVGRCAKLRLWRWCPARRLHVGCLRCVFRGRPGHC